MPEQTTPVVPRSWRRVHLAAHPPGVTVLSLPFLGTGWVRRGVRYWWGRVLALALFSGMVALQVASWWGALGDHSTGGRLGGAGWAIVVVGVLGTLEGLRMVLFRRGIPLFRLWSHPRPYVRGLYALPLVVYLLFVVVLTPGLFLSLLVEWLRPTLTYERTARADLDAQLLTHGGQPAGR
ncbi:hypothetical protein [Kitasatospora sp. LaBMicrA B282]|uniref:hypothetical protein n=1 Tax=Kitasatospora sp. LaBMicrA B282 TaxID=3420949 RepID=UPI003D10015D